MGTEQLPTRVHVGTQAGSGQLIVASLPPGTTAYIRADVVARLVEAAIDADSLYTLGISMQKSRARGHSERVERLRERAAEIAKELSAALRDARQAMGEKP